MVSVQIVKDGIKNRLVNFIDKEGTAVCQIGDYWFYFLASEDEGMTAEEFCAAYSVDEQAEQIAETVNDWEAYGLGEDEATYYSLILQGK